MLKNTLLTGANGLVGSTINCDKKIGSEYDLRSKDITEKLFEKFKPTNVIHCAAKVGGLGANINYKGSFFYDNIMMNTNVVEAARKYNVKKLVMFLSTCIFPDNITYPLTEEKIHLGPPHNSNYPYAYAKRMADIQIRAYREQYNLNYVSVIPTNIYGPNDNFSISDGHVIPSLIHKTYLAKKNNEPLIIWGTGTPEREFIFSEDIGKLTSWALNNYNEDEPIIFSNSQQVSIKELVKIIADEFSFEGKVIFDTTKPDGQIKKPTNNSKLLGYLPNFEFTPIQDGLKKTISWFIENYENARK